MVSIRQERRKRKALLSEDLLTKQRYFSKTSMLMAGRDWKKGSDFSTKAPSIKGRGCKMILKTKGPGR